MNYGEGITWIIVFKCSIQFVETVGRKMESPGYSQMGPSYLPASDSSRRVGFDEEDEF